MKDVAGKVPGVSMHEDEPTPGEERGNDEEEEEEEGGSVFGNLLPEIPLEMPDLPEIKLPGRRSAPTEPEDVPLDDEGTATCVEPPAASQPDPQVTPWSPGQPVAEPVAEPPRPPVEYCEICIEEKEHCICDKDPQAPCMKCSMQPLTP